MNRRKKTYRVIVDTTKTQAAIDMIQQRLKDDVKRDFLEGINEDGTIPRGLYAAIARRYGYTQTWVKKILKNQGIITTTAIVNYADTI